jgi:ribosomal protein L33
MEEKRQAVKTVEARGISFPHLPRICEHEKQKAKCKECGGSRYSLSQLILSICEHEKQRDSCKDCGGSRYIISSSIKYL